MAALVVFNQLWRDPAHRVLDENHQDYFLFEWVAAHAARSITHFENPLYTDRLNAPTGVNMMANTSALGVNVPLAPVTLLFGPSVTVALFHTIALAGTAIAWYYVLSRHVVRSRPAAFVGAAFCGFAPSMISQATGHPNIAAQFMLPLIVWRVIRLREPEHWLRNALIAGGLAAYQAFINEEMLFLTAMTFGAFLVAYWLSRPDVIRRDAKVFLRGLGVAVGFALLLLAYPLVSQFFGPQTYHGLPLSVAGFSADLASFPAFSSQSLAGDPATAARFAQNRTEENSFFGWPLLALLTIIVIRLRREPFVRALAAAGITLAVASLGRTVVLQGESTGVPGPWRLLAGLPVFDLVLTTRLALFVTPIAGVLLAVSIDRVVATDGPRPTRPALRLLWVGAVIAALLPVVPMPLAASNRPAAPDFISAGGWREYVADDRTLVPMPLGWPALPIPEGQVGELTAMWWAADQRLGFRIPEGYFLGPDPTDRSRTLFGTRQTATSLLVSEADRYNFVPDIGEEQRRQAREDARFWQAAIIILPANHPRVETLRITLNQLYGTGELVDDVWLWDVRPITS